MAIDCECWSKLTLCCPCKLNTTGYISGWFGIIWRTVLIALLSSTLANITEYDPSLYTITCGTCLGYFLVSVILNFLFLYGIFKERRHFMLPYITIAAMEMVIGTIVASAMVMLLFAINAISFAIYTLFIALLLIGVLFTLWLYNILLYKEMEFEAMLQNGKRRNVSLTGMVYMDNF